MNPRLIATVVGLRLRRVAADRANLIWLILMPLVFSYLMGMLMGNWSATGSASKPTFIVFGLEPATEAVTALLAPLADHPDFELVRRDTTATPERARSLLEDRVVAGALLVGPGFADSLRAGLAPTLDFYHDSDRTSSQRVRQALEAAYAATAVRATVQSLVDPAAAPEDPGKAAAFDAATYDSLVAHPRVRLAVTSLGRNRTADLTLTLTDSRQHSGPSYTLMFILMFLLMSAKDLVLERRQRTLDRLRLAWPTTADLVAGFFLAGMVVGLLQAALLLGFNAVLFRLDYGPSPACLALVVVLFVAVSSAAGLLLGTLSRTGGQADGLGMVFGLALPALGGLWWPLEIVPDVMQRIGRSLPTGQAITVFHDMIGRGWGLAETAPMLWGLAAWLAILLGLAVYFFRREIRG
ncbi:MAG TPA: ABC transporter permease [Candidatus Krumholzibacteria bacterium]|nr:ABC transporter permease [Candidatus Krumholzibacteria bacterium]HPD71478.1 ABC transporter permease [Candidatus Krumholzibacteria bacterium]HRY41589.1 ABC transporter permease [Candidatus Krumholzibacteria bacterium]